MTQPTPTVLAQGQRGTATTISFTAQPTTSLLVLLIADPKEQFSRNAPAVTNYTNRIDGDSIFVYTKVSAGETTIDLPADPNTSDAAVYAYTLLAFTEIDTANPIAATRTEQAGVVCTSFTNEAVAGERYWLGFVTQMKSFGASSYTVNNSYTEITENSQAYGGGATVMGGTFYKYVASAAASEDQGYTITPGASQGNKGVAGLVFRVSNLNKSGTGSISPSATVASSSGIKGAQGTGSGTFSATVSDSPGTKAAFGTGAIPELAVLTSDGEGEFEIGGTGFIESPATLEAGLGFRTSSGSGTLSGSASLSAVGSKAAVGDTDSISVSPSLSSVGSKGAKGTAQIPVSTVTFSADEFKAGFGYGAINAPVVLTGEGEELLIRFGTASLFIPIVLTALGKKSVSGTCIIPVASMITSLGHDGPLESGIRRWNGTSEDIVKLFILESRSPDVEREASIEAMP